MHGGPLFSVLPTVRLRPPTWTVCAELTSINGEFVSHPTGSDHVPNRPFTAPIHPSPATLRLPCGCYGQLGPAPIPDAKAKVQRSVFGEGMQGMLPAAAYAEPMPVPSDLTPHLLDYLARCHGIGPHSLFPDFHAAVREVSSTKTIRALWSRTWWSVDKEKDT